MRRIQAYQPRLVTALHAQHLAGSTSTLPVIVVARRRFLKRLTSRFARVRLGKRISYAALNLKPAEIIELSSHRGWITADLDAEETLIPAPLSPRPANHDVCRRYRVPPLDKLTGGGVVIMVADTGIGKHMDIPNSQVVALNFVENERTCADFHGHGSHIIGQILSQHSRYAGVAPGANVVSARIFGRDLTTRPSRILRMLDAAIERKVDIISMSYGGPIPNPVYELAYRETYTHGIFLCAAAGNSGPGEGTVEYPGGYDVCMAVGAIEKNGKLANFSSRGRPGSIKPDCVAEGVGIVSCSVGNMGTVVEPGYSAANGTSFAAPIVSAIAALLLEAQPTLSPKKLKDVIIAACETDTSSIGVVNRRTLLDRLIR